MTKGSTKENSLLIRVPVVIHEHQGNWNRQLRPRLRELPVQWFESRSECDLESGVAGLPSPIVLIDLGREGASALKYVRLLSLRFPDARILVLNIDGHSEVTHAAREFGATFVYTGFVPPPVVAGLMTRWIAVASRTLESSGWSRIASSDTETEPWLGVCFMETRPR